MARLTYTFRDGRGDEVLDLDPAHPGELRVLVNAMSPFRRRVLAIHLDMVLAELHRQDHPEPLRISAPLAGNSPDGHPMSVRNFVFHDNPGADGDLCSELTARRYKAIYIQNAIDEFSAVPCPWCLPGDRADQIAYDVYMETRRRREG